MKKLKIIIMLIILIFLLISAFMLFKNPKVFWAPIFVKIFIAQHPEGYVSKCIKGDEIEFAMLPSMALGSGSSLYDKNGTKITDCHIVSLEAPQKCDLRSWQCEKVFGKN